MVIVSLRVLVLCGASLVLGHPLNCQACLDIALKIHLLLGISGPNLCFQYSDLCELILRCAVHPQDDIRAKAIRLVARKLYVLGYIVENIEQFATRIFLLALDRCVSDVDLSQSGVTEQRIEREIVVVVDDIFCLFHGHIENVAHLKQQYGLNKIQMK